MENHPHSRMLLLLLLPLPLLSSFLRARLRVLSVSVLPAPASQLAVLVRSSPTGVCAAATSLTLPPSREWRPFPWTLLVHRCTHRPPTGDPQYAANSHKAPADTQMDKRMDIRTSAPGLSLSLFLSFSDRPNTARHTHSPSCSMFLTHPAFAARISPTKL